MLIVIRAFYLVSLLLYTVSAVGYIRAFASRAPSPGRNKPAAMSYGVLLHLLGLVTYSVYLGQAPFLGMFQGFSFAAFGLAALFILIFRSVDNDVAVGMVVMPLVAIFALIGLFTPLEVVHDELLTASPWFILHASVALLSYGAFAIPFAASVLYILLHKEIKSKHLGRFFERLPSLDELDHLTYFSVTIGFVALTVSIATGVVWTLIRLGKLLQMDAKEIITFINWLIFALYLHSRYYGRWRGKRAAWLAIAGFAVIILNFVVVTLLLSKTHAYM